MLITTNKFIVVLLGRTAAESKTNFMNWVDDLVASVAGEQSKVYSYHGIRQQGTFTNLKGTEYGKIAAKLGGLGLWTAECINNGYSCGTFIMIIPGGRGYITHQPMCIGPFQS